MAGLEQMGHEVTQAIRQNVDNLKTAAIYQKADIAETILEGILSVLTDYENRLIALEKKHD